jgi:hypothetical protein
MYLNTVILRNISSEELKYGEKCRKLSIIKGKNKGKGNPITGHEGPEGE